jgi:hypothetical protein
MVNHGNMSLTIEAGLAAINWPTGCYGGREFIHTLLALLNGRQSGRVIATHSTVAGLMSRGHLSRGAQHVFISRHVAGVHRIAERINRAPLLIESGTCKGNATRYDLRPLLKFAIAVLSKYDEKKNSAAKNFNPSAAIFSLISPALIYLPVYDGKTPPLTDQESKPDPEPLLPPNKRVTHLGYQIRYQSPGFAKKLELHDFQCWVAAKVRIILEKARQGKRLLPLHYIVAPGVCSCREARKCKRQGKHPFGKLVRRGVFDATGDLDTLRPWFIEYPFCNVGMVTDDELVIDIDFRNGGHYSWRSLQAGYEKIAKTYREKAGNGWHNHFQRPAFPVRTTKNELGRGIDVITGPDHYVVIHPSFTLDAYKVHAAPLAPLPEWLLDLMLRESPHTYEPGVKIKPGHRNYWLWTQGLQKLREDDLKPEELDAYLWELYLSDCEAGNDPIRKPEIRRIRIGCFQRLAKLRRAVA